MNDRGKYCLPNAPNRNQFQSTKAGFAVPQTTANPRNEVILFPPASVHQPVTSHPNLFNIPPSSERVNRKFTYSASDNALDSSPPSYEEAVAGMAYVNQQYGDYKPQTYHPDYSQFSSSEPYFYAQTNGSQTVQQRKKKR